MKIKKYEKTRNYVIDRFYGELKYFDIEEEYKRQANQFEEKLDNLKTKLEVLEKYGRQIQVDVEDIIEKGFQIKNARRGIIETVTFSLIAISILTLYIFLTNALGVKFLVASQLTLSILLPWVVVLFSVIAKRKGEII